MQYAITHAVLFALGKVQGPVEKGALEAANARGFLRYGRPSDALKAGLALLSDEAWREGRELTDAEIIADVASTVAVTLDWQRADAQDRGAQVASALRCW